MPSGIVPSNAVLPGWAGGPTASQVLWQQQGAAEKPKCAQCGGARLWVHSSAAHNLHVKLHGHLPLLALSLVSQHDVSKPHVSLLSEKDITVNTSFETYSFLSPISHYFLTAKMKVLL